MKNIIALILIMVATNGFSQFHKSKYKKLREPNSKLITSGFNFTVEKINNEKYIFKQYFPENKQITHFITFNSKALTVMNGLYAEYYDDGKIVSKGVFNMNKKTGEWIEFRSKGIYINHKKHGKWINSDHKDRVVSESNFVDGELNGKKLFYDTLGNVINEEIYDSGELISSTLEANSELTILEKAPSFPGCENFEGTEEEKKKCAEKKLLTYIHKNIKYPNKTRNQEVQGKAIISFVVEKDGMISNIKPLRGITKEIQEECIKLIKKMPKWNPGLHNGKPVRVQFNLPILFRLN